MSLAAGEVLRPAVRAQSGSAAGASALPRVAVYLACSLLALLSCYLAGKEMAWDTLNYHLYLGFSAFHDRFSQDYFAAGAQSYFNPYAYAPFYAMVSAGFPALLVAGCLALFQSSLLWLTFELGVLVAPAAQRDTRLAVGLGAAALAFLNPILIQQLGTSFADITTAPFALAGWLALARATQTPRARLVALGGLALGIACALKPTNAVHAVAATLLIALLPIPLTTRLRHGLRYAIWLGVGFVAVSAPWSYRLEQHFGNPLFPLLNNVFRSPGFTVEPLRHLRFVPSDLAEALWRPFAMLSAGARVHEELSAPDLRYAVLVVLAGALGLYWLWQRMRGPHPALLRQPDRALRTLVPLAAAVTVDWVLWLYGSGNSRYFLPLACVATALLVALIFRIPAAPRVRYYILATLCAAQALQAWQGADHRWNEVEWDGPWFQVKVPERLTAEPNLYLSMGVQSNSFLVPYLAPGSGFVNFSGGYALGAEGAAGERIAALIRRHAHHVRMLASGARVYRDDESRAPSQAQIDGALQRLGLRVDLADCAAIAVHGLPPDFEITIGSHVAQAPLNKDTSYIVSCAVVPAVADQAAFLARQREVDVIFDRLEDTCPLLFQPRRMQTEHPGTMWLRNYLTTDVIAWVDHGEVEYRDLIRGRGEVRHLGKEIDWARGPLPLACFRRDGEFFAVPGRPNP